MSHCEAGNHTNSWVPISKRGQTIQRDEAGLFSRVATTHPPGPEEQNQQKQAWPSSVASSPSVTVSGIGYGAESALTSEASLTARLVEYEHLLERR